MKVPDLAIMMYSVARHVFGCFLFVFFYQNQIYRTHVSEIEIFFAFINIMFIGVTLKHYSRTANTVEE